MGLCLNSGRNTSRVVTPVVQHLRHMYDLLRSVCEPKNHIMILAAVVLRSEKRLSLQQCPLKHAKMTDVIICSEIVRRIVRLKMYNQHMIDIAALKGRLITVEMIRPLLIDRLHILKQHAWMQNIILIQQSDVFPGCQFEAGIRVCGNTAVHIQMPVNNPSASPPGIFPTDVPDIAVRLVGAVRQTKLPVLIGLVQHRIKHCGLKLSLIVPERHQNTDLHHMGKYGFSLRCCAPFIGEAVGSELLHRLAFPPLVVQLPDHTAQISAVSQPVPLTEQLVCTAAPASCLFHTVLHPKPSEIR